MQKEIYFFGPDGSGKTTLARMLVRFLTSKGMPVRVSWMRGTHTLASLIARFLAKFNTFHGDDNPYFMIRIPRKMLRLWYFLEFVSILPIVIQRFIIPSLMGFFVIAERCLVDFIVWLIITTKNIKALNSLCIKPILYYLLKTARNHTFVYITADIQTLMVRSNESYRSLLMQVALYNVLGKYIGACVVNTTNKNINESLRDLVRCVHIRVAKRYLE